MPSPTYDEIIERAMLRANRAMWSIHLQIRRIHGTETDEQFLLRREIDFEFLVVALWRLRRAALLARKANAIEKDIKNAIYQFDSRLPGLRRLRDTAEHIDEYSVERGKESSVERRYLENRMISDEGRTWSWLDASINTEKALDAASELFESLKACRNRLTRK